MRNDIIPVCIAVVAIAVCLLMLGIQQASTADEKPCEDAERICRELISSYEADRLAYEQYRHSQSRAIRSLAEQARERANRTAATYNDYARETGFRWQTEAPAGAEEKLERIELLEVENK